MVDALGSGPSDAKASWRFESSSRHHFFFTAPRMSSPPVASAHPVREPRADLRASRDNMIERQIRAWEVLDDRVLALYRQIPREDFIPPENCDLAYCDTALPVGFGQFALEPKLEARMLQEMNLRGTERVLHVGTGSGFFAALLARICAEVVSVEIIPELAESARGRIAETGAQNVSVETGDAARGWASAGPVDAVVLTGSVPVVADEFRRQTRPGGFILAVTGQAPAMTLRRMEKSVAEQFITRDILETFIPPLQNAPEPERFKF